MMRRRLMFLSLVLLCSAAWAEPARSASAEFFPEPLPASVDSASSPAAVSQDEPREADEPNVTGEDRLARTSDELRDALSRRLRMFADELAVEGYRSERLIDHLASLADLYRDLGQDLLAVAALDWALELSRINRGLHSLDAAALLEPMIESVIALEDYETARLLERRLLELTFRNPGDPRVALILATSADRHMRETERILGDGNGMQVTFAVGSASPAEFADQLSNARRRQALASLATARRQYAQAIAAGVNSGYAVIDLLELEERLLSTYYLEMSHPKLAPERGRNQALCYAGEAVIENSVGNVSRFRESPTAAASVLIKLADWRLLCSRNARALDTYDSAYETLVERGADPDIVAELLSPQIPAALPAAFQASFTDGEAPEDYRGYIDVSFVVGRYGTARNVEILGESPGTSKAVRRELRAYIAGSRFRPRFVDGEPARVDRVTARYYYR